MYSVYIDIDNFYILIISVEILNLIFWSLIIFFSKYDIYVIWYYKKYIFYKRYLEVVFSLFNLKKVVR